LLNNIGEEEMTYNKPVLVVSGSSVSAIQGTQKGGSFGFDNLVPTSDPRFGTATLTINAYEADE
jgi:hypothetical protein